MAAIIFMAPTSAWADAFPQPAGTGRVIATTVYSHSDKAYAPDGEVVDIADYEQVNVYIHGQYGLTDDLTLILSPSFRRISIEGTGRESTGLNFIETGARYRLATVGETQLSLQGTVRILGESYADAMPQLSQLGTEFDVRGTVGSGFTVGGAQAFVAVEAGYRIRTEEPPDEFHLDATVGVRPAERLLLLLNSFNTISNGAGENGFGDYRYHNLYASAVYDISESVSLEVGAHMTLGGENALRERGLLASLWLRF